MGTQSKIPMAAVESSAVSHAGYDPDKKILAVKYKTGDTYHYAGVSPAIYAKLKGGDSFMGFMRDHIMGKHPHKKL